MKAVVSYEVQGIKISTLQYEIKIGDQCQTIVYTQADNYDWMAEFEASAATIKVVEKQ